MLASWFAAWAGNHTKYAVTRVTEVTSAPDASVSATLDKAVEVTRSAAPQVTGVTSASPRTDPVTLVTPQRDLVLPKKTHENQCSNPGNLNNPRSDDAREQRDRLTVSDNVDAIAPAMPKSRELLSERHSGEESAPVFDGINSVTESHVVEARGPGANHNMVKCGGADAERATIVEHHIEFVRSWAEGLARLNPGRPPGDVPPGRWSTFIDDCARFLNGDFAATAVALGWGPLNVFGCDRDRPFARIDQAGLCWLIYSARLVTISENTATIQTKTGARQTFRRKPNGPGQVLPWELSNCTISELEITARR